jgi:hypothetical protein
VAPRGELAADQHQVEVLHPDLGLVAAGVVLAARRQGRAGILAP